MTVYLYGFVDREQEPPPEDLMGVAGRPVRLVETGPLQAAVSDVPDQDFRSPAVEERLHDLEWVSEQGALHERVVTWFVDHGAILPARFLTLYSDADVLHAEVEPRIDALATRLEELSGVREWDLKVSYREKVLQQRMGDVSERVAELDSAMKEAAPGRRYLLERKRATVVREESAGEARRLAREALDELAGSAADHRRLPLPTGAEGISVILSAALLVATADEESLRARASEIAGRLEPLGIDLSFTGPWAPYRFLSEEDDAAEGGDE